MGSLLRKLLVILWLGAVVTTSTADEVEQPRGEWLQEVRMQFGDNPLWADPAFDDNDWTVVDFGAIPSEGQIFWVRRWVEVDPLFVENDIPIGLTVSAMASSEIYWNGELLDQNGVPGPDPDSETPGKIDFTAFLPGAKVRAGPNLLALRMSSQNVGSDVHTSLYELFISRYRQPLESRAQRYAPVVPTLGIFLLGLLYFGYAAKVQKRRSAAWLALASLMISIQMGAEISRAYIQYPYDWHLARLGMVWLGAAGFGVSITAFVSEFLFGRVNVRLAIALGVLVMLTLLAPGWDSKTALVLYCCFAVSLGIAARGFRRRGRSGLILFVVLAITSLLAIYSLGWLLDRTIYFLFTGLLLFLFSLEVQSARRLQQALAESRLRTSRLELEILKKQIEPHFIMNTLTALSEWIEQNPRKGVEMIEALADEFRLIHQLSQKDSVLLVEELALCDRHLQLMSFRRRGAFRLDRDIEVENTRIPPAIFHTLIENGLTHGRPDGDSVFKLLQRHVDEELVYTLQSPPARDSNEMKGPPVDDGIGHAYIRSRLRALYGEKARFEYGFNEGCWTTTIAVPSG